MEDGFCPMEGQLTYSLRGPRLLTAFVEYRKGRELNIKFGHNGQFVSNELIYLGYIAAERVSFVNALFRKSIS